MGTRLYVGNLSDDVSSQALRARFAEVAAVSDVQLAVDRSSGRMRGYAFVTMETIEAARAAIEQLDGAYFEERRLRVNEAGEEREGSESKSGRGAKKPEVRVTTQFRERNCMTYELDCAGVAISIRMFPADPSEKSWRIEASMKKVEGASEAVIAATAATRALALAEVARTWDAERVTHGLHPVTWKAITEALLTVRAV